MAYHPYMGYNMKKWASERLVLKNAVFSISILPHCASMKKYDSLVGKKLREVYISRFADTLYLFKNLTMIHRFPEFLISHNHALSCL